MAKKSFKIFVWRKKGYNFCHKMAKKGLIFFLNKSKKGFKFLSKTQNSDFCQKCDICENGKNEKLIRSLV